MNISSVTSQDSIRDFFNTVDAARKRNTNAFGRINTDGSVKTAASPQKSNPTFSLSAYQPYGSKTTGADKTQAKDALQPSQSIKQRILGGFFDAYA
jgi:hypothetical protein